MKYRRIDPDCIHILRVKDKGHILNKLELEGQSGHREWKRM